jgi:hypothetical protein
MKHHCIGIVERAITNPTKPTALFSSVFAVRGFLELKLTRFLSELTRSAPECSATVAERSSLDVVSLPDGATEHELQKKRLSLHQ